MTREYDPNKVNYFLVSWDVQGVEYLEDVTKYHPNEWAKVELFEAIKTNQKKSNPLSETLTHITLRARFNPQRFYECYLFTADKSVSFDDIKKWADEDPQGFADFVRKNYAKKILDHRTPDHNKRVIT